MKYEGYHCTPVLINVSINLDKRPICENKFERTGDSYVEKLYLEAMQVAQDFSTVWL